MDPGRYGRQQGWDTNSALEGYGALHEQDFRAGGSYGGRRLLPEGFSRDSGYARTSFHHDILERDIYPPTHVPGVWPQPRRSFDEEYALVRDSRRNVEPYHEIDNFGEHVKYHEDNFRDNYRNIERYHDTDSYHDYGYDRHARFGGRDHEGMSSDYEVRRHLSHESRENSRDRDYDYDWYSYDSDHERGKRDGGRRRRESRDREHEKRGLSRERDQSPYRRRERSRSHGRDDRSRSRSPRGRTRSRSHREDSYEDGRYERNERRRDYDRDEKRHNDSSVAPSATIVVKGLSQKTTEDDLYQFLAEWGPLRHIRVIKERNSGVSRGFAFIDFPDVDAARRMMDGIGDNGLVIDGRKLFFEYSSKPTGGAGAPSLGQESFAKSSHGHGRSITAPCDWICTMCGCLNFARRTSCFQCNEPRTEDAPPADVASTNPTPLGKRGSDLGPTHVLVVRGLDENADEEMLRYEFAKHAAIKDLRLVRDKFTHVSRGFAFVHFHSVEDATKALEATNGTTLEKNGQVLRVAYAKSIHGPGSGTPQSSSLAAAAIEAATFAQQYDAVGWTPKEYNPDQKQSTTGFEQNSKAEVQRGGSAPQSGFVWDEKSGYYYDAASGFYYDGNTGLYYDGNNGVWYSYDHQTQQYVPCNEQSNNKAAGDMANETSKGSDGTASKKVVISAAATTVKSNEKASLPDAVHAAATAALAAEKKEKEKLKEIKLASKSNLLANKKKMNNVLAMWKQRNHEGQAARVVLDDKESSGLLDDKPSNSYSASVALTAKNKLKSDSVKEAMGSSIYASSANRGTTQSISAETVDVDSQVKPRPVSNSLGGTIMGVIRGSGKGIIKSDTTFPVSASEGTTVSSTATASSIETTPSLARSHASAPFKTDASALGSYGSSTSGGRGKRRFSEAPALSNPRDQIQTTYRDRAAERRNLYGSSSATGDDLSDLGLGDPITGTMPFPPGVGGRSCGDIVSNTENYEVITADRAIDESNVGNRMLRSMGWQEGLGLGKDGSGIKEPVQAKAVDDRSGLGSQQRKVDPSLEAQSGDSYRTIIQKKAIARFREMA
ncbi:SUPPRESSOR OF ABI3-5-like isoform X3 [Musa acuminata AAA Group]|uniref:SUPPRESSOR OF ABI3-5-like isoform X3 n=1 Tax=Musa acuminata AAA Group TaxID=214697 RepID=UPI0031E09A36